MTPEQAIEHACRTVALAYRALNDYSKASDGFCAKCSKVRWGEYLNDAVALEYVRVAVVEKLVRDGHTAGMIEALDVLDCAKDDAGVRT